MNEEIITNWFDTRNFFDTKTLLIFAFILLIALTALLCSKSGIINIALEGQLAAGVFGFVLFGWLFKDILIEDSDFSKNYFIYFKTLISIFGAFLFISFVTLIFSYLTISFRINQILVGIGINIIVTSVALFLTIILINDLNFTSGHFDIFDSIIKTKEETREVTRSLMYQEFGNSKIYLFLPILLLIFIVPFIWFFFSKTTIGLRIRASGESMKISKLLGVSPQKYQYISLLFGIPLMTLASWFFIEWKGEFSGSVSGFGYIGLSMMILGRNNVLLISIFSLAISSLTRFATMISVLNPAETLSTQLEKNELQKFYHSLKDVFYASIYAIPLFVLIFYELIKKIKKSKIKKVLQNQ